MTVTGYRGNRIYINLYSRLAAAWAPALYVSIRCLMKWELKYNFRLGFAGAGDGI